MAPVATQKSIENDRKKLLFLLAVAIGVILALFKLAITHLLTLNMTISCSHKSSIHRDEDLFLHRDVLPTNVVPLNYDLVIEPDMTKFVFNGKVSIE